MPQSAVQVPPHDLDAEMSVIGSILLDPSAIGEVLEFLRPQDFYRENNGLIFEAATKLYAASEPIDNVTLAAELQKENTLDRIGGRATLASYQGAVPTAANVVHYGRLIKQHSLRRQLMAASVQITRIAQDEMVEPDRILQDAQQLLFAIAEDEYNSPIESAEEILREVLDAYEKRKPGELSGLPTGFADLDRKLNGLKAGEVYIIAARPNMGKTSWALQVARTIAENGTPAAIFSLEMSRDQIMTRLLCQEARIDAQRFERHELNDNEYGRIMKAAGPLSEAPIYVDDSARLDEIKILHRARQLASRGKAGAIIIDYIQLLEAHFAQPNNRVSEVTAISRAMKAMARDLKVPILAVSQLSRAPEARKGDHRPMMSDLRESGALEQDAAAVAFLYRPEYYKAGDRPGVCEVIIAKNRFGPTGTVDLVFRSQLTRFELLARGDEPQRQTRRQEEMPWDS